MQRSVAVAAFVVVAALGFFMHARRPIDPSEARAALAAVEACHRGEAILLYQLGEEDPAREPLHTWALNGLARGRAAAVNVPLARLLSMLAVVVAGVAGALAFGRSHGPVFALFLMTPGVWATGSSGTPGALLAMWLVLAWSCYEWGRRINEPTLQWTLPPILAAAAALTWSPAFLLVAILLIVEIFRAGPNRRVAWLRVTLGSLGAAAMILVWQIPYRRLSLDGVSWWSRVSADLVADATTANASLALRLSKLVGLFWPALVVGLVTLWFWKDARGDRRISPGVVVASIAALAAVIFLPVVPIALMLPVTVVVLGGSQRELPVRSRRFVRLTELALLALLGVLVVAAGQRGRGGAAQIDGREFAAVDGAAPVVVDRELSDPETWAVIQRLSRPGVRRAEHGQQAWYVGPNEHGPGFTVSGPRSPEAWSLLARPLESIELKAETRAEFEAQLGAAQAVHAANLRDPLASIWVGRRLAYLGRYWDAIDWYGEALLRHPSDSRLWRHRGHRYITVRHLDDAIAALERAAELEAGRPDRVEPDGLPTSAAGPRSTTQTNIWYHLGLAYYLKGELEQTVRCYRICLELSSNDDSWVAAANWLHIALRRLHRDDEAAQLLQGLHAGLQVFENDAYRDLLQLYAGRRKPEEIVAAIEQDEGSIRTTLAYGFARWLEDEGRSDEALLWYRRIVNQPDWSAFGFIAAEAELAARAQRRNVR